MIYSIVNQKGGVGKTALSSNLGYLCSGKHRTLLIDCDPQAGLTSSFGLQPDEQEKTTKEFILQGIFEPVKISSTLDLLPANLALFDTDAALYRTIGFEKKLKKKLAPVQGKYEYIFLDCPPSLGLLALNALVASDRVIVPVQCEYLSMKALAQLLETVAGVQEVNPTLTYKIVFTMFSRRTVHAKEVVAEVREGYPCYNTVINRTIQYAYSTTAGQPLAQWEPNSEHTKILKQLYREMVLKD